MEKIKKHKWLIHWTIFCILIILFVFSALFFEHKLWIGNVLQTIGTIAGIYLTLIIFLYSKEGSDKQFREHLDHLQNLNHKQIEALQQLTEKQISTLQELNTKQIEALQNSTEKQITTLQGLTEKQIEALHKTTYEQITSFEKQINEVTNKLSDNSVLLAEILGRELEKSLTIFDDAIKREEAKYKDLTGFKLLRTKEERDAQLNRQWNKIEQIKRGYEYIVNKYNQLRNFLGKNQKGLNG